MTMKEMPAETTSPATAYSQPPSHEKCSDVASLRSSLASIRSALASPARGVTATSPRPVGAQHTIISTSRASSDAASAISDANAVEMACPGVGATSSRKKEESSFIACNKAHANTMKLHNKALDDEIKLLRARSKRFKDPAQQPSSYVSHAPSVKAPATAVARATISAALGNTATTTRTAGSICASVLSTNPEQNSFHLTYSSGTPLVRPTSQAAASSTAVQAASHRPSSTARLSSQPHYLFTARSLANKKEGAADTITRWLTNIIFKRNLRRHLYSRDRTKQQCRGAVTVIKSYLLSDCAKTTPAPAPSTISIKPTTPKMKPYPTMAETHPFRQRGLSLPPKKKRRPRRRFHRPSPRKIEPHRLNSGTSTPSPNINHHPTRACKYCPAFFHHQHDLNQHATICHQLYLSFNKSDLDHPTSMCHPVKVTSPVEPPTVSTAVSTLPQNPCPPPLPPAPSSLPSHRPTSSNTTTGGATYQDRVRSPQELPPISSADIVLHQNPSPPSIASSDLHNSPQQHPPPNQQMQTALLPRISVSSASASHLSSGASQPTSIEEIIQKHIAGMMADMKADLNKALKRPPDSDLMVADINKVLQQPPTD